MTMRNSAGGRLPKIAKIALAVSALGLAGCSTPGPLHLYSIAPGGPEVHDLALASPDPAHPVPSFLGPKDELTGFAYDPFTDHFFLRLAPGNHIRVVDRPARKIKREFTVDRAPETGGGDLALNPRTGHLYLIIPGRTDVVETSRLGEYIRQIALGGLDDVPVALAFDPAQDHLLALAADRQTLTVFSLDGTPVGHIRLDRMVESSLAFDAGRRELYAPLRDEKDTVGVFSDSGKLTRRITIAPDDRFIDVGPHSFLRIF